MKTFRYTEAESRNKLVLWQSVSRQGLKSNNLKQKEEKKIEVRKIMNVCPFLQQDR